MQKEVFHTVSTFSELLESLEYPLSEEQRAVVYSDKNCVVSAGAGSGKTTVLSWRFLRLVMEKHVSAERILTLTFTRKAALEMKSRITRRLIENRDSIDPELLEHLGEASISTIDSFLANIVRMDSVRYGISRDLSMMDDDAEEELVRTLSLQFLEDEKNRRYTEALSRIYKPDSVRDDFFTQINKKLSFLSSTDPDEMLTFALDYTDERIRELKQFLSDEFSAIEEDLEGEVLSAYDVFMEKWERGDYPPTLEFYKSRARKGYLNGSKESVKELSAIYKDQFLAALSIRESLPADKVYLEAIDAFSTMLKREKRKRSALTFSDISDLALDILTNSPEIRNSCRSKYDYIMIDEFQDNNNTQRKLLFLLSEKEGIMCDGIPTVDDISPEKLFFVGDDKQSIYRFRGADVSVFNELRDDIRRAGGENLSLSTNYRSEKLLIEHFNSVFRNVFASREHSYDAAFTETKYSKDTGCAGLELALLDRADLIPGGLDAGECEAEFIAKRISEILTGDAYLINGRRPESQDIAVLMRTGSNQMNIERSLKRRGIPYQVMDSRSLMTEALSSDFYSLLQYMIYPEDKTAYTALMKSPFVRLSDSGLLALSKGEEPDDEDRSRIARFEAFLSELRESMYTLTLPSLIRKIYTDGGYRAYIEGTPSYRAFSEHFEYLHSFAVSYAERGASITEYIRFLRNSLGTYESTGEVSVLRPKREGVQIMTIHKSKGLEFPIVIIASMGSQSRGETAESLFSLRGRLLFDSTKGTKRLLNREEADMNDAEIKRILYVAMTRAENYLLLTGSYKKNKDGSISGNTGKLLSTYLSAIGYSPISGDTSMDNLHISHIPPLEEMAPEQMAESPVTEVVEAEELPLLRFRPLRVKVTDDGDEEAVYERIPLPVNAADEIIAREHAADAFGTLAHLAMELSMNGDGLESLECDISGRESENETILEVVKGYPAFFRSSELFTQFVSGHEPRTEVRFYTYNEENDGVLEGVIDLVVFLDDYNLVIDYKTDRAKAPLEHKRQVVTYVKTAEKLWKKPCYGTLFYLREGKTEAFWDRDGNEVSL